MDKLIRVGFERCSCHPRFSLHHAGVTYRINRLEGSCRPLRVRAVILSLAHRYFDDLSLYAAPKYLVPETAKIFRRIGFSAVHHAVGQFFDIDKQDDAIPFRDLKVSTHDSRIWRVLNRTKDELRITIRKPKQRCER